MGRNHSVDEHAALAHVRWRWAAWAAASLTALVSGYLLLRAGWAGSGAEPARLWLLLAGPGTAYMLLVFWRGLEDNRRAPQSELLPGLGPGTLLTLVRGLLVALLSGFLLLERPPGWLVYLPALLYTIADITDYLDGYAARVSQHQTRLGERLDMSFDSWGVLVGSLLIIHYGQVPFWYLSVALARPLYVLGLHIRSRLNLPVYELPYRVERRALAGVQMGFIAVMLWPVFTPPGTHIAAAVFTLPFLAGFLRDWLTVSGVLSTNSPSVHPPRPWLPWGFRLAVLILGAAALWNSLSQPALSTSLLWLGLLQGGVVALIALGASGRATAIAGLLLLGFQQALTGLDTLQLLLIGAYTGVLFFGTGPYSVWTPEDWLIHNRAGEGRGKLDSQRPA
jgi:CDP-diacylglycerol---glycerol-3-phosphate 3-phosphatidyltransferase